MKKFIRIMAWVLSTLMLLSVGACSNAGTEGKTEQSTEDTPGAKKIVLNEEGKEYVVVRGDSASQEEIDLAIYVRNSIKELTGFDIGITTDYYGDESQIGAYEVLVGSTNRAETAQADNEINGNGFVVAIVNGKIVIDATNNKSLEEGCDYFLDDVLLNPDGMFEGFCATCQADSRISGATINGVQLKDYVITAESKNAYILPIYTANRYFSKYCGVELKTSTAREGFAHQILIGGKKPDGSDYGKYEIGIWYADGNLHLGCANATSAQQVLYTFFAQYLNEEGVAEVVIPEDGTQVCALNQPDNWDAANPKFLTIQDKIVRSCYKLECILQMDIDAGKPFTYRGSDYKNTIAIARQTNTRMTNCVIVGNWVLKDAGFFGVNGEKGIYNHKYDGTVGWTTSGESTKWFADNMIVTRVWEEGKGVSQLTKEGRILPGDIIGYKDHNQTILPEGYAFDGGRFSTNMGSEARTDGRFERWVCPNPCPSLQVGYIVRAKDAD